MKMKKVLYMALAVAFAIGVMAATFTGLTSRWEDGDLVFHDGSTDIMSIKNGTDGVIIHQLLTAMSGFSIQGNTTVTAGSVGSIVYTDESTTTCECSIPGLTSSYNIVAVANSAWSEAVYVKSVVPGTDKATITFSGDPGTTVTFAYAAWLQQ